MLNKRTDGCVCEREFVSLWVLNQVLLMDKRSYALISTLQHFVFIFLTEVWKPILYHLNQTKIILTDSCYNLLEVIKTKPETA